MPQINKHTYSRAILNRPFPLRAKYAWNVLRDVTPHSGVKNKDVCSQILYTAYGIIHVYLRPHSPVLAQAISAYATQVQSSGREESNSP